MIGLHIKTSFQYIRRQPLQALAAISILVLTFFVATLITVVVYASNQLITEFETRPQVIVFLKKDTTDDQVKSLQDKLGADKRVKDLKYVPKEEAVNIYKEATADNPQLAELVSSSIFPASLEFSVTDLDLTQEVINEVKKEEIVDDIGFTASIGDEQSLGEVLNRLKSITSYIRSGGALAVLVLGTTSFLVLMVVISLRIQARKSEVETLSLIGATKGFIRTPIVFEAIIYAVVGAIIGWLLATIAILYATPTVLSYFGNILPKESSAFFGLLGAILLAELIISIVIAIMGSMVAVIRAFR